MSTDTITAPSPAHSDRQAPGSRASHVGEVYVADMRISDAVDPAQREINNDWVNKLVAEFDPDAFGLITVNLRSDGKYYIVDGQHRVEAMRLLGWDDQKVDANIYEGLTLPQEAELFLQLNRRLAVPALATFRVGVTAGREEETAINEILEGLGLRVGHHRTGGAISAVGTLRRVYRNFGGEILSRALAIIKIAFGDEGLSTAVVDGMAMFVARYGETINDDRVTETLGRVNGGARGLLGRAETLRATTAQPKHQCVGAAIVDYVNAGRGGRKLRNWWAVNEGIRAAS